MQTLRAVDLPRTGKPVVDRWSPYPISTDQSPPIVSPFKRPFVISMWALEDARNLSQGCETVVSMLIDRAERLFKATERSTAVQTAWITSAQSVQRSSQPCSLPHLLRT